MRDDGLFHTNRKSNIKQTFGTQNHDKLHANYTVHAIIPDTRRPTEFHELLFNFNLTTQRFCISTTPAKLSLRLTKTHQQKTFPMPRGYL